MSFTCHTCRDTCRVTDYPRFYGDPQKGVSCPYCAPPRETPAQAEAQRIADCQRIEDEIERLHKEMVP